MTSRGPASVQVASGLPEVLGCRWIAEHASAVQPTESVVLREQDGVDDVAAFVLTCWDKGYEQATIDLADVNWFNDAALVAEAPDASWQAFLGSDTEQPGLWLAYTPTTGLVEGTHIDHEVVIPLSWAHPARRTGAEEAQLARITAVVDALHATQADPVGLGDSTPQAVAGPPATRMATPTQPDTPTAATPPVGPRGRGISR
jgi:hypothetical protein